jgi:hypothetical protein
MKPKCVEFSAVFDDGTIQRWEGKKADQVWSALEWDWLDPGEQPTITKPMRRVTKITGHAGYVKSGGVVTPQSPWRDLDPLLPTLGVGDYELTIVAEVVPIEK